MSGARRVVVITGAALLAVLLLYPPFMVIDSAAARTRHAALGYHPRWRPPSPVKAEEVLRYRVGPPPSGVQPSLQIRINRVRLVLEVTATAVGVLGAWVILRRDGKRNR